MCAMSEAAANPTCTLTRVILGLTYELELTQPRSQGSLSCFEKGPWLRLVTWKCVSIKCTAGVGPQIHFVDWTMKYPLG